MKTKKVYKTEDGTILIVTAQTDGTNGRKYVSVTANEIQPMSREDAVRQCREQLEDGENWKMAVENDSTELGLDEWIEYVLRVDGELAGLDNSLYTEEITIDGTEYIFDSRACGCLHDYINKATSDFKELIELHLKDKKKDITKAENIIAKIKSDNVDAMVEKLTREILSIEA